MSRTLNSRFAWMSAIGVVWVALLFWLGLFIASSNDLPRIQLNVTCRWGQPLNINYSENGFVENQAGNTVVTR